MKRSLYKLFSVLAIVGALTYFSGEILQSMGDFLVHTESPEPADAAIVLNTGTEYYARLVESADLYKKGLVKTVVINGNRKSHTLRLIEQRGFTSTRPWYAEHVRILEMLGVPREEILTISAEDAYDTVTEAAIVGRELLKRDFSSVIVTTSKFHSRRAHYIWTKTFADQLQVHTIAARHDPFDPANWWRDDRQARWVLAEYGGWLHYYLRSLKGPSSHTGLAGVAPSVL